MVSGHRKKGLHSLIILGAWTLWLHRNDCVFNGAPPRLATALVMAGQHTTAWGMAGAHDLALLAGQGQEMPSTV